jgi:outer membrane autotransporter protein
MDYRFSKSLVAGFGLGYGRDATDIGANGTESRAHAYSGAVYASYQPFKSTYLDGLIGGSWLDLSSKRYETASGTFAMGDRSGTQIFGSITASYEKRDDAWLISPYGRLDFSRSWLDGYTESGSGAGLLRYGSQTVDTVSGIAGLRVEYAVTTDWGTLKPGARIEYVHDFAGSSQVSLGYADTGGLDYVFQTEGKGSDYVTLGASLDAALSGSWTARFDYRTAVGGVGQSHALGLKVGRNF